ncbi:MAG: hypothetical protein IK100_09630 [Muribaculaceae bacterium]|nr:hypothetical protein [Muribaculaceae bacterium]
MALTLEQQNEIKERNAKIYERYCNLSESQPLAYDYTIFAELGKEFGLTQQSISLIVRTAQKEQQQ